jgi:hypothetical protein
VLLTKKKKLFKIKHFAPYFFPIIVLFYELITIPGWESQLLETGFLAIFLCPLFDTSSLPRFTPTSKFVIWGYRWLIFRIMLGAVSRQGLLRYNLLQQLTSVQIVALYKV